MKPTMPMNGTPARMPIIIMTGAATEEQDKVVGLRFAVGIVNAKFRLGAEGKPRPADAVLSHLREAPALLIVQQSE